MREITTADGRHVCNMPENWTDINTDCQAFALCQLAELMQGKITPFEFQTRVFCYYANYKPARHWFGWLRIFQPKKRRLSAKTAAKNGVATVRTNLAILAEQLTFFFDVDGDKITPKYEFTANPVQLERGYTPQFNVGLVVDSNITAGQYADAADLATNMPTDEHTRQFIIQRIVAALYKSEKVARKMHPVKQMLVYLWFCSVMQFFATHKVYSLLYRGKATDGNNKITLGMGEILLQLETTGYNNPAQMGLIEFFNAQIKALKDNLAAAIAKGAKVEELAAQTGLTYSEIIALT